MNGPFSSVKADSQSANRVFLLSGPFPFSSLSLDKGPLTAKICEGHC